MDDERLSFLAEWFKPEANLMYHFLLNFYPQDNSLELIDTLTRKPFLRRSCVDSVCEKDFHLGARVFVLGRKLHITDYGNEETKNRISEKSQRCCLIVSGQLLPRISEVFDRGTDLNLHLNNCFTIQLCNDDLQKLNLAEDEGIKRISTALLSIPTIVFDFNGKNVHQKSAELLEQFPDIYSSSDEMVLDYFFKVERRQLLPRRDFESVLCLIKPHAVHSNQIGKILAQIQRNGFVLANMKMCHLDRSRSEDFLRVYEGVMPEFIQMTIHLSSGALLALELISNEGDDMHTKFRNLCGPHDPEIAKKIRPHTLRAEFGLNKVCNAVHCTDLKEDCHEELEFFFN